MKRIYEKPISKAHVVIPSNGIADLLDVSGAKDSFDVKEQLFFDTESGYVQKENIWDQTW